jgi:hypothetical protein
MAAHLKEAKNIVVEGVRHSPKAKGIWYGSPEVQSVWIEHLIA